MGQSLWIGSEEFEDLDEIIARYVNPMAAHARDLLSFKYYRDTEGLKDKAEEVIKEEKKKNASKIHYVLGASKVNYCNYTVIIALLMYYIMYMIVQHQHKREYVNQAQHTPSARFKETLKSSKKNIHEA